MAALDIFFFTSELVFRFLPIIDTGIQIWNGIEVNNISNHGNNVYIIFLIIANYSGGFVYPEPLCCPEPVYNKSIEKAKRLCNETASLQNRVSLLIPNKTWTTATTQNELTEALQKLTDISPELKQMIESLNNCEKAAFGIPEEELKPVNKTILQEKVQRTRKVYYELSKELTKLLNELAAMTATRRKRSPEGNENLHQRSVSFHIKISLEGAISLGLVQLPGVCLGLLGVFKAFQLHGLSKQTARDSLRSCLLFFLPFFIVEIIEFVHFVLSTGVNLCCSIICSKLGEKVVSKFDLLFFLGKKDTSGKEKIRTLDAAKGFFRRNISGIIGLLTTTPPTHQHQLLQYLPYNEDCRHTVSFQHQPHYAPATLTLPPRLHIHLCLQELGLLLLLCTNNDYSTIYVASENTATSIHICGFITISLSLTNWNCKIRIKENHPRPEAHTKCACCHNRVNYIDDSGETKRNVEPLRFVRVKLEDELTSTSTQRFLSRSAFLAVYIPYVKQSFCL